MDWETRLASEAAKRQKDRGAMRRGFCGNTKARDRPLGRCGVVFFPVRKTRFWAFITFLSRNYAQLLTADPPEAYAERTDTILREVKCVPIEVVRVPPRPNGLGQRSRLIQEAVPK